MPLRTMRGVDLSATFGWKTENTPICLLTFHQTYSLLHLAATEKYSAIYFTSKAPNDSLLIFTSFDSRGGRRGSTRRHRKNRRSRTATVHLWTLSANSCWFEAGVRIVSQLRWIAFRPFLSCSVLFTTVQFWFLWEESVPLLFHLCTDRLLFSFVH